MLATKLSTKEQLNEEVLLQQLAQGNYKAFAKLYDTHVADVTHYASRFTEDIQIIEDALHDVFVWLWNNRSRLKITCSLKAYLFKSVRTSILRKIQKSKKTVSLDGTLYVTHNAPFYMSNEEKYVLDESRSILKEKMAAVLGLLTCKQKEVIYLRFYHNLSFDDISVNMNLSTKACYKLMGRAISELRRTCTWSWPADLLFFLFFLDFMG